MKVKDCAKAAGIQMIRGKGIAKKADDMASPPPKPKPAAMSVGEPMSGKKTRTQDAVAGALNRRGMTGGGGMPSSKAVPGTGGTKSYLVAHKARTLTPRLGT